MPPPPTDDDVPLSPESEDPPFRDDSDEAEDVEPRDEDDDDFSGPPPLAEDPREKKAEVVAPVVVSPTASSKKESSLSPKAKEKDNKKPMPQAKGKGPLPQVVRVVMTDSNAQFMTLRCDPHHTVDEFSQVLAKKLSLKGKGQVEASHFSLCLLDPRATRDPKRLQPGQNVLAAFKDSLRAAAGRYVLHLVPAQNISAGVTKTIRASFAVSSGPSSKTPRKGGGGLGGISEGLPTTKSPMALSPTSAAKKQPTKEQLKEEELRKMNEDLKKQLAITEKQLKQQESTSGGKRPSKEDKPQKIQADTLKKPSPSPSPRASKEKIKEEPRKSNENIKSPKSGGSSGSEKSKGEVKSLPQSRASEKRPVMPKEESDDDDDDGAPPPPDDDPVVPAPTKAAPSPPAAKAAQKKTSDFIEGRNSSTGDDGRERWIRYW